MSESMESDEALYSSRPAPGQQLAEAREERGWSVAEVAMRLKFSVRQIAALEADAYHALPGVTIVRGMVRSYAKALGLDPQPLVAEIEQRIDADPLTIVAKPSLSVPLRAGVSKKVIPLYVAGLVVALMVGAALWWGIPYWRATQTPAQKVGTPSVEETSAGETESPTADAPTQEVREEVGVPSERATGVPPATLGNKRIEFQFDSDAWVEIKDGDGKMLMAQLNHAQTRTAVEGKPPFTLIVGSASAVHMNYEGNSVDLAPFTRSDVARLSLN